MQSPLINPYSSISILHESDEDFYTIKYRGESIPLYKFAKGYHISSVSDAIHSDNTMKISNAKIICRKIYSRLGLVANRLRYYEENRDKVCNSESLKRDFIDNNINSNRCYYASEEWKRYYQRLEDAYKEAVKKKSEMKYKYNH
jgi:hypothetical protein